MSIAIFQPQQHMVLRIHYLRNCPLTDKLIFRLQEPVTIRFLRDGSHVADGNLTLRQTITRASLVSRAPRLRAIRPS